MPATNARAGMVWGGVPGLSNITTYRGYRHQVELPFNVCVLVCVGCVPVCACQPLSGTFQTHTHTSADSFRCNRVVRTWRIARDRVLDSLGDVIRVICSQSLVHSLAHSLTHLPAASVLLCAEPLRRTIAIITVVLCTLYYAMLC